MDEYDRIVWAHRAFVRGKFELARHRASLWVPRPMPEGWR
jgi:hypothetical protein